MKDYQSKTNSRQSEADLRNIQELLGHNSSKTTGIYAHVGRSSISKIVSPLDRTAGKRNHELL